METNSYKMSHRAGNGVRKKHHNPHRKHEFDDQSQHSRQSAHHNIGQKRELFVKKKPSRKMSKTDDDIH